MTSFKGKALDKEGLSTILSYASELETLIQENGIQKSSQYQKWSGEFSLIYDSADLSPKFYGISSILYLFGYLFAVKSILPEESAVILNNSSQTLEKNIGQVQQQIFSTFPKSSFNDLEYFRPLLGGPETFQQKYHEILSLLENMLKKSLTPKVYLCDSLYQSLISALWRHSSGEYYTPPFLVRAMVKKAYQFGQSALDPCCGTGNFLIEILRNILKANKSQEEKIAAINQIYGYDLNPLSLFLAQFNLLYLLKDFGGEFRLNLYRGNSLFESESLPAHQFDLVISNPPWYTYRDIQDPAEQERIKNLATELKIKPLPKNILNIEISTLFFYHAKARFMKPGAHIFFVITKGVITGSHASRFRNFRGFRRVEIWRFDSQIENIFNIDFICIHAEKGTEENTIYTKEIPSFLFTLPDSATSISYFDPITLVKGKRDLFVPFKVDTRGKRRYTGKLIPKHLHNMLLPVEESPYKKLFHKGADLNPRTLIFVEAKNHRQKTEKLATITPDPRVFKRAKKPWDKKIYTEEEVPKKYLFNVVKSTELLRFFIYDHYTVFLPLEKPDLRFEPDQLPERARSFYEKINRHYLALKKSTTKNQSLMDNLNRWSKLINERQVAPIKVVYNNSGSLLSAAVVQGDYLVTGDLSFYSTESLEEAYYLAAILNCPAMQEQIKIKKSSRHIFKLPFSVGIKKFNPSNQNHLKLAALGKKAEVIAKDVFLEYKKFKEKTLSKRTLQKRIQQALNDLLTEINTIFLQDLSK